MSTRIPVLALSLLALESLACGCNLSLPSIQLPDFQGTSVPTGPTQTDTIQIPAPDASPASLEFNFGAGEFNLAPGAASGLVEGTATYNVAELKPEITQAAAAVTMSSGKLDGSRIPLNFGDQLVNTWDLRLGAQPIDLAIHAGAYRAHMDLGGLSLNSLSVDDGAAMVDIDFAEPNQVPMKKLSYSTGASRVSLTGLANAEPETLTFNGGAGDYTLDFTGDFRSNSDVNIEAGVCQVTLVIPQDTRVVFDLNGGVANIDMQGSFQGGGTEFNPSADGPILTIHVDISAGQLTVRNP